MRAGTDAPRATAQVMKETADRIGTEFERLSTGTTMRLDKALGQDIGGVLNEYGRVLPSQQREIVQNVVDDILAHGKQMQGVDYQLARSRLSRMAKNNRQKDPDFAEAIAGIRDALDGAMGRSISGPDKKAWATARKQWGNMRVLERAVTGAGEDSRLGLISPSQLRNATVTGNRSGFARGAGDLSELANAGEGILKPLPNSGTAPRAAMMHMATGLVGAGLGAGAGTAAGEDWKMSAAAGALGPGLAGRVLLSRPMQAYLGRGLVSPAMAEKLRGLGAVGVPALARPQASGLAPLPYPSDRQ